MTLAEATSRSSFDHEDLLACGRGEMFGPGNAQLPAPPMLMVDRIVEISRTGGAHNKGFITAELDISPQQWFFLCHFYGDPVMPGCLGLDAMWQLGVGEVKFAGQVTPTVKKVVYRIDMKKVIIRKLVMGVADGVVEADGKPIYTASDLRVGLFDAKDLVG